MFDRLLIANRGEIACRIARTARRLGIRTIAIYSEADARARHVAVADEAHGIGPAPTQDSYLNIEAIIDAARRSGAEAVHPGYGFLSENAEFAEACAKAGLRFVGPPPDTIRAMGSKSAAREIMGEAGVPLVPGYHGADQDWKTLQAAAAALGYPVLLKASAGGGGRGMRVVEADAELIDAIAAARRESLAAFGDDRLLVERYIERPRHIEIQVFADNHGKVVHLFERDCSLQRRHQKVVEEAPAPGLDAEQRHAMGEVAVAAAKAIGYVGAGTVVIEMNTRLQVEHPVTEMVTGHDLVEWQLRVAAGESLPCAQDELSIDGHAFEVRLYAEDPSRDFLPGVGRIGHLRLPAEGPHVRIDSGVVEGDEITAFYDPMIAKLIAWDMDRDAALRRLRAALAEVQIAGIVTNLSFLNLVAGHPAFAAGDVDTHFFERHATALLPEAAPASDNMLALAALHVLLTRAEAAAETARASGDPHSPWHSVAGWRLNDTGHDALSFRDGETELTVPVRYDGGRFRFDLPGGTLAAGGELEPDGDLIAELDGMRLTATVVREDDEITILAQGHSHRLVLHDPAAEASTEDPSGGRLVAPMPGKIVQVLVSEGDRVERGAPLVIVEAMKMEHTITAPAPGRVEKIHFGVGEMVDEGAELVAFEAGEEC
jgi:3-methylcrotonyl-CoA carboxylase alpha subunit